MFTIVLLHLPKLFYLSVSYQIFDFSLFQAFNVLPPIFPAYNVTTTILRGNAFRLPGRDADTMKGYIEERAVEIANYIIENNATVRQTAKQFGISKSTVHKDVTERLSQINPSLASRARVVLDLNKSERHIRGGMATKEKYMQKTKNN